MEWIKFKNRYPEKGRLVLVHKGGRFYVTEWSLIAEAIAEYEGALDWCYIVYTGGE